MSDMAVAFDNKIEREANRFSAKELERLKPELLEKELREPTSLGTVPS
ncbi:MAG: hypothetical protein RLY93_13290 [Sumerlaeia bacterium]